MPSTFLGLNIGNTGLYAYQSALNTTAHNIANAEAPGYSRQVLGLQAGVAVRANARYGMIGTGVNTTGVSQVRNEYYDIKYRQNNTLYGEYSTKEHYMGKIENYFNEVNIEGFTTSFDSLYDSLQELGKDPSSLTARTQVLNFAQSFTEYFNSLSTNLKAIQEECNFEIKNTVDQINSLGMQISTISQQINTLEANGGTANDLRDQRALLVDQLSGIVNISVVDQPTVNGSTVASFTIQIDGHVLVDTGNVNLLQVVPREEKVNQNDMEGLYEIVWFNGDEFDMGSPYVGGALQGIYELRDGNNQENLTGSVTNITLPTGTDPEIGSIVTLDNTSMNEIEKLNIPYTGTLTIGNHQYAYNGFEVVYDEDTKTSSYQFFMEEDLTGNKDNLVSVNASVGESIDYKGIPYYMTKLNEFVRTFSKAFNDIHKEGKDLNGENGLDFFNGTDFRGDNFELNSIEDYYNLTAGNFTVTVEVFKNPSKIAAAADVQNGVEDHAILDQLIGLKSDSRMFKSGTPASFLQTMVGEIGIDTRKAASFSASQGDIVTMIDNQRLSVSGVDIDEEAMNLVRFQNAYNLSAKVISVMDEIYDRLINGMGA